MLTYTEMGSRRFKKWTITRPEIITKVENNLADQNNHRLINSSGNDSTHNRRFLNNYSLKIQQKRIAFP